MNDRLGRALPGDPDLEVDEDSAGRPRPIHLTPSSIALVFAGGTLGVLARAVLDQAFPTDARFPATTFVINVVGALALAILIEALAVRGSDTEHRRTLRLVVGTGLLGGFTTYSALAVQTDALLRSGQISTAATYAIGTVALGLAASIAGIVGTRRALAR